MYEEYKEFTWLLLGFILAAFMMTSLNIWSCVCTELATPVPKAMEGRETWVLEREQKHDEYINSRRDVIIFDKEESNGE